MWLRKWMFIRVSHYANLKLYDNIAYVIYTKSPYYGNSGRINCRNVRWSDEIKERETGLPHLVYEHAGCHALRGFLIWLSCQIM